MKRTLLVVLTIAILLFAFAGTASAFSTTPEMQSAIQKMKGLGIMEGYPDGTMGPERNITRAEFSKMAVITAGLEGSAQMLQGTSSRFSDVQTNAWYTGWINLAEARGFVKGYPDGTFQPNGNITYSEVITVLLRILGYNDNLPGAWPVNYLAKATQLGITDDVAAFSASSLAVRGNVAILAGATLDENVVEWKAADQLFADKAPVITLIEQSFGSGAFSFTGDLLITDWSFDGERFFITATNPTTLVQNTYAFVKDFNLAGAPHVQALQDQYVDILMNKDNRIVYAENKNYGRVQFTGSDTGQFDRAAATVAVGATRITVDGTNYTLAPGAILINPAPATLVAGPVVSGANNAHQGIRLVKNKDGQIIAVRALNTPPSYILVDEVTTSPNPRITAKDNNGANLSGFNADVRDADTTWVVFKGGVEVPLSVIQENDLVRILTGAQANGYDYKLDVFPAKATGTLTSIEYVVGSPAKVIVDGKKYDLATSAAAAGASRARYSDDGGENFTAALVDMLGGTVTLHQNAFGGVEYVITDEGGPSAYIWGVVTDIDYSIGFAPGTADQSGVNSVEIINAQGNEVTYATNSKSEFNGNDKFRTFAIGVGPAYTKIGPAVGELVKFTVNADGTINKMYNVVGAADILAANLNPGVAGGMVNKDLNSIKIGTAWFTVAADAAVWNVVAGDWEVSSRKALLDYFDDATNAAYNVEYFVRNNVIEYIAVTGALVTTSDYAVVTTKGRDADGYFLDLLEKGTVKRYEATLAQHNAVNIDELVAFTTSANKITTVTTEVYYAAGLEREVKAVNRTNNSIEIYNAPGGAGASTLYFVDADTLIYDLTDDDARYVSFNDVYAGDVVIIPDAPAGPMAGADNVLYYLYIKN